MRNCFKFLLPAIIVLSLTCSEAFALPPVAESKAFKQYLKKPKGEFAKLVCLLNYYKDGDFTIRYDGFNYAPSFVFPYAKAWLFTHYNNEKAEQWVRKNCYVSPFERTIIYVKLPDREYEPARDMILRDLADLEKAIAAHKKS